MAIKECPSLAQEDLLSVGEKERSGNSGPNVIARHRRCSRCKASCDALGRGCEGTPVAGKRVELVPNKPTTRKEATHGGH